jgi:hypothetical protein
MTVSSLITTHSYIPAGAMLAESLAGLVFINASDLVVTDPAGVVQVLGTDYEITGNGRTGSASIRTLREYGVGVPLTIMRETDLVQDAIIEPNQPLPAESIEKALDRSVLALQEFKAGQNALTERVLRVPRGEIIPELQPKAERQGFAAWDVATGGLISAPVEPGLVGASPVIVSSRAVMGAITGMTAGQPVLLTEAGRAGTFIWDASDLSAMVTADIAQGVYVAPLSAPTGASGAWVRSYSGWLNVQWFGAKGDGVTDDRAAILAGLRLRKPLFFPRGVGSYIVSAGFDFGAYKLATGIEIKNPIMFGEGAEVTFITFTGTGTMFIGGTNAPASGGYIQSCWIFGFSFYGTGSEGNGPPVSFGTYTSATNALAGTTSTQRFMYWEFNAPAVITGCEFRRWGEVFKTKFGYTAQFSNLHIWWCGIAFNFSDATTSHSVKDVTIERCAISVALYAASKILFVNVVSQGNYGGADVVSYNWNTLIKFDNCYFEISTTGFYHDGDSLGIFVSNNYTFVDCKHLDVLIKGPAYYFYFGRCRLVAFSMEATDVENIVVEDNTVDADDGYTPFTAYSGAGAPKLIKKDLPRETAITYSASMTPDCAKGETQVITATNNTAFTINLPTNISARRRLRIIIRNTSGGALGVASWNALFKMSAWTQPASGQSRSITFEWDGNNFVEVCRNAADVPN